MLHREVRNSKFRCHGLGLSEKVVGRARSGSIQSGGRSVARLRASWPDFGKLLKRPVA